VTDRLAVQVDDGVLHLVLARGDRGNAIDLSWAEQFDDAVSSLTRQVASGDVRTVLLRAEGANFCVGGDLRDFPADESAVTPHLQRMARLVHRGLAGLYQLAVPVMARLNGAAAGAGVGLVAAADLVVAARSARFVMAYTAVGLSPDCGTSWLLPRVVGLRRAIDLTLTRRTLSADEAESWGLVSRVVEDADLDAAVSDLVSDVSGRSTAALVASKRLLRAADANTLPAQLADEAQQIAHLAAGPDAVQARTAFLSRSRA